MLKGSASASFVAMSCTRSTRTLAGSASHASRISATRSNDNARLRYIVAEPPSTHSISNHSGTVIDHSFGRDAANVPPCKQGDAA
jgi:hypothetical protein